MKRFAPALLAALAAACQPARVERTEEPAPMPETMREDTLSPPSETTTQGVAQGGVAPVGRASSDTGETTPLTPSPGDEDEN